MSVEKDFANKLYERKHRDRRGSQSKLVRRRFAEQVLDLLFPVRACESIGDANELTRQVQHLSSDLGEVGPRFFEGLPEVERRIALDAEYIHEEDPASVSVEEVIFCYPGFYAIATYRIAHLLWELGVPLFPRVLTEHAHEKTGIDIHPAAQIGCPFFIDHGTGIVVGETCIIGNYVKLFQGVTLGALSVDRSLRKTKRHPTLEDYVLVYSGTTILGGDTVVGRASIIGGNVWLTKSVPANSRIFYTP